MVTHEPDEFGTKLSAMVFVSAEKVCHFVE